MYVNFDLFLCFIEKGLYQFLQVVRYFMILVKLWRLSKLNIISFYNNLF